MFIVFCLVFILSSVTGDEIEGLLPEQDAAKMSDRDIIYFLLNSVTRLETERVKQQKRIDALEDAVLKQGEVIGALQNRSRHEQQWIVRESKSVAAADVANSGLDALKDNGPWQDKPATQRNRKARTGDLQTPGTPVAFSALASHQPSHIGAHQNLVFDVTNVNTLPVYNPHNGVFTVPIPGVYIITATILANSGREVWCDIVVNGAVKAQIYARGTDNKRDQGTQTIMLNLEHADAVSIRNEASGDSIYGETTFSGFLLYEDGPGFAVIG